MSFRFPASDLDTRANLIQLLGTHWNLVYQGQAQVDSFTFARGQVAAQQHLDLLEAVATVSRLTIPVFHTDQWYMLTIRESELNDAKIASLRYGDGAAYGNQSDTGVLYRYGEAYGLAESGFPSADQLKQLKLIFNRIIDPSVSLVQGLDFRVDAEREALFFRTNPFDNDLIPKRDIYEGSSVVDRELALWLYRGQFDLQAVYRHFGYALGLRLESSDGYRELVNALWDNLATGANLRGLQLALSAILDVPVVTESSELVEHVLSDSRGLLIITDQHAYRFGARASAVVAAGETVYAGQRLVDTFRIDELNSGEVPEGLNDLELPPNLLTEGYAGGLVFVNDDKDLVVTTDGVFTKVAFELGGWDFDVEKFFDDLHARGVENPPTLAQLLDVRTNPVGEPEAESLPATVNPLEFLLEHVLRHNVCLVRINVRGQGDKTLGLQHLRQLRRVTPPHILLLIVLQLAADPESITMDGPGDELNAGGEESAVLYETTPTPAESVDPETFCSERAKLRIIDDSCT